MFWDQSLAISDELEEFEVYFQELLTSNTDLLEGTITELAQAGGKRIRPALVMATAGFGDYEQQLVWSVASAIEILHMATLVHDDIIDEASLRRGETTIQLRYGKDIAVFTGDYLFSLTFNILSTADLVQYISPVSKLIKQMCQGEIQQYQDRYQVTISYKDYLQRIKYKTALLFETSCLLGANLGGLNERVSKRLGQYGRYLGMAFQLTDDVLDFIKPTSELGKPNNNDFTQGIYTLPILYVIQETDYQAKLEELLYNPVCNKEEIKEIIISTRALDYTLDISNSYLLKAKQVIDTLPSDYNRRLFYWLADQVLERTS
ncbi:polyprenyl synthetase family protein [Halanaerobaculum tunisiense]